MLNRVDVRRPTSATEGRRAKAASQTESAISSALLEWYGQHGRELPWRGEKDPYRIWVSEIMLQQTRVAAVREYYARFIGRFPTLSALAEASGEQVLAEWSGLGYYRRARMLHAAAKQVHGERAGKMPSDRTELLKLPGIGRYTAAAIASIAFGQPSAVVDGNVERVLLRLQTAGQSVRLQTAKLQSSRVESTLKRAGGEDDWQRAQRLMDARPAESRPGDFNQAMMELGAMVCTPKSPRCGDCPLRHFCRTRGEHPVKAPAARRRARLDYLLARRGARILLIQRNKDAAQMPLMWELPEASAGCLASEGPLWSVKHSITDTDYTVNVFRGTGMTRTRTRRAKWFAENEVRSLPLTGLTRKVLKKAGWF